jgi:DNA repair protein RadA/Sms
MPVPAGLIACGEVGLGGEVRQVAQTARRLAEAARLGFTRALVPSAGAGTAPAGLTVVRVNTVADALAAADLVPTPLRRRSGEPHLRQID